MLLPLLQPAAVVAASPPPRTFYELAVAFQGVFLFVISGIFAWTQWSLRKVMVPRTEYEEHAKQTAACYDGIDRRVTGIDRRVDGVENAVQAAVREIAATAKQMLTREEYGELRLQLERTNGSNKELNARLEGTKEVLTTTRQLVGFINEHMINETKG